MTEWLVNRCNSCGQWGVIDKPCSACSTLVPPTKGDAEMQNSINGGNE